jgi:hypothetical protein
MLRKQPLRGALIAALLFPSVMPAADDAPDRGAELLKPFKQELQAALRQGLEQGPAQAIQACRIEAPRISASLSVDGVTLGRSSHRLRNPANAAPEWVTPIMESWVREPGLREPLTIDLPDSQRGYVEPIVVQPLCLACHGENLEPDVASGIRDLYPDDQATGFEAGDFRGVFWVEFPRDE